MNLLFSSYSSSLSNDNISCISFLLLVMGLVKVITDVLTIFKLITNTYSFIQSLSNIINFHLLLLTCHVNLAGFIIITNRSKLKTEKHPRGIYDSIELSSITAYTSYTLCRFDSIYTIYLSYFCPFHCT